MKASATLSSSSCQMSLVGEWWNEAAFPGFKLGKAPPAHMVRHMCPIHIKHHPTLHKSYTIRVSLLCVSLPQAGFSRRTDPGPVKSYSHACSADSSDHCRYSRCSELARFGAVRGVLSGSHRRRALLLLWQLAFVAGVIVSCCWFAVEGPRTDPNK